MYMLDTNICIYIIKRRPSEVLSKFEKIKQGQICISIVTYAELKFGVEKSSSKQMNQNIVEEFVARLKVDLWDVEAANHYAKIRYYLEHQGTPIRNMDMMIAAHARSQGCRLVTNNLREFERVPDLKLENWIINSI
ncbi:MAG: type II toxin-antitoxin system VapC family toxin [SAR324 cluster bacterium]|nr:type II toxin-antitoxin system VapC family toxin [SAR324 cluster bacterium]